MQGSALLVDEDEDRRRLLARALGRQGVRYLDVADAFAAMGALGRADFSVVIAVEGRRMLSLRGLCQLARRHHPNVEIFVIHREESDTAAIAAALGAKIKLIPASMGMEQFAGIVDRSMAPSAPVVPEWVDLGFDEDSEPTEKNKPPRDNQPGRPPAAGPATPAPVAGFVATRDDEVSEPTERMPRQHSTAPISAAPASVVEQAPIAAGPLLEGVLEAGSGPALLLGLFAQELTGRLVLKDGAAAGTIFFFRGEPVWAEDALGDAGLHRRLVQKGKIPATAVPDAVAEGMLLGSLVQQGILNGQAMHDFMREFVRDVILALAAATSGAYRFEEDRKFLEVAPLLRLNPFGLVLEARRKAMSPGDILEAAGQIEGQYVIPGPSLGAASDKLTPFVRGVRLAEVLDGTTTVGQVLGRTYLDQFMGTLVFLSLRDTRLVSLEPQPRPAAAGGVTLTDGSVTDGEPEVTVVDAEHATDPPVSADEAQAREEIFSLYMRLKPLTLPRQVLGVGVDADLAAIESAYQQRMRELDPRRVPEGSAQHLLAARIEELRRKVSNAYNILKLQAAGSAGANDSIADRNTNPF